MIAPLRRLAPLVVLCLATASTGIARADELSDVQRLHYAGQTASALQLAERALQARPNDPQLRFMKGVMLADAQRPAEARSVFEKLTDDYPDLAEPYNNLAALYAQTGDYPRARATLEQALRTNPGYATAHENLGDVYVALAAQAYARAQQLDATNTSAGPKLTLARQLIAPPALVRPLPAAK
jgi:Flp pilus assembly protein TadD